MSRPRGERVQDLLGRYVRTSPKPRPGLPASVRRRLDRSTAAVADARKSFELPADLSEVRTSRGAFAERTVSYAAQHRHGRFRLVDALAGDARVFALLTGDAALAGLDLRRAVFLDTETTGLGGGAGVYVFLVGLARFVVDPNRPDCGTVEVWQGLLRSPEDEVAMLSEVARRIEDAAAIVSFFGKSFDRHRLEDKMRIAGVATPFAGRPHLDLYHPLQRLTRGSYADGRLATLEAELCGFRRPDDLPGAFAPEAWFDFLAERPHRLGGVFRHNEDDVLSLFALAGYLGHVLCERYDGAELAGCALRRASALAQAWSDAGDLTSALQWSERALARARGAERRTLILDRARLLRKRGDFAAAKLLYAELAAEPESAATIVALLELAKHQEHRDRDPAAALALCERALRLAGRWHTGRDRARVESALAHRAARLQRKLAD